MFPANSVSALSLTMAGFLWLVLASLKQLKGLGFKLSDENLRRICWNCLVKHDHFGLVLTQFMTRTLFHI
jgi:hypothetical protein